MFGFWLLLDGGSGGWWWWYWWVVVVVGACSTGIAGKMGKRDEMDGDGRVATAARTAAALTCLSSLS